MARFTLADFSESEVLRFGITQAELDAAFEREQAYLSQPPKEITDEQYYEALGCLPPENWYVTQEGISVFRMSEYQTGSITTQYGHYNGKYIQKYIDVGDKTTWIDLHDIINAEGSEDAD